MHNTVTRLYTAIALLAALYACVHLPAWAVSGIITLLLLLILTTEWPRLVTGHWWLLTPLYPVLPFVLAIALNQDPQYRPLLALLIICVSAHDMGAYCIGKLLGKHKLLARISPGKTWQGFGGGLVCVLGSLVIINVYQGSHATWYITLPAAIIVSCVATAGDLFESWLKRRAGLKDSGSLLPGHGGLLDRFDGMMSCIYLVYPLKDLLLRFF